MTPSSPILTSWRQFLIGRRQLVGRTWNSGPRLVEFVDDLLKETVLSSDARSELQRRASVSLNTNGERLRKVVERDRATQARRVLRLNDNGRLTILHVHRMVLDL
jgi:hypothetical protein